MSARTSIADWERWLRKVFHAGCLDRYLGALEALCEDAGAITRRYVVTETPSGHRRLDPQLFEDLQVRSAEHRAMFEAWFRRECGAQPATCRGPGSPDGLCDAGFGHSPPGGPLVSATEASDWALGDLSAYSSVLRERFVGPEEIAARYACAATGGARRTLSPQFFEDLEIHDLEHRALFAAWFASPAVDVNGELAADLGTWLHATGLTDNSAVRYYRDRLLRQPAQPVSDLIAAHSQGGRAPCPQLFEEADMQDLAHQRLVKRWFASRQACGQPGATSAPPRSWLSWVDEVDWSVGELAAYAPPACLTNEGLAAQVLKQYGVASPDGRGVVLSPRLFEEMRPPVRNLRHRAFFEAWFVSAAAAAAAV